MAENGKKQPTYIPITSPVESMRALQRIVGRILEWDRLEELDAATNGEVSRVVRVIFQSLEPVQAIEEDPATDYMEWEVPKALMARFFGPLFYFIRDAESCPSCYKYGRLYLNLMAEKLMERGVFSHRDLIHVGLSRFDGTPTDCTIHQSMTPGGTDE